MLTAATSATDLRQAGRAPNGHPTCCSGSEKSGRKQLGPLGAPAPSGQGRTMSMRMRRACPSSGHPADTDDRHPGLRPIELRARIRARFASDFPRWNVVTHRAAAARPGRAPWIWAAGPHGPVVGDDRVGGGREWVRGKAHASEGPAIFLLHPSLSSMTDKILTAGWPKQATGRTRGSRWMPFGSVFRHLVLLEPDAAPQSGPRSARSMSGTRRLRIVYAAGSWPGRGSEHRFRAARAGGDRDRSAYPSRPRHRRRAIDPRRPGRGWTRRELAGLREVVDGEAAERGE